ncbi:MULTISPECIES: energy-coupling factor ABC transporter ATP-binding protein [Atopobiaceae]|uniref:Energy-coupling factor transport system ATP-binding protein n=2 Tax=Parafannyhessea umbonata TaxID=604330 RepID=A0A1H6HM49_9ACTN|nr:MULTISPECIES: ATP-binding cassette domain-containing protein [Atopobiaceae]SEH36879.1 energy-coupling factor transport system ATP-binding protein [Parafannyhessea umbonata]SJZ38829.1 energy-coupling factor transport system ATP-binding protein [Olsenella sp. KH1P3]
MGEKIVEIMDLTFAYPDGTVALENINLSLERGSITALIGQNGCGKTTLSKLVNGILRPTSGSIVVGGLDVSGGCPIKDLVLNIGYVFQNPDHQLFNSTVYDEIAYAPRNVGLGGEEVDSRVREAARISGVSESLFEESPMLLSRGLRQRVAIASILSLRPKLIIVDEPTTGQDRSQSLEVMEFLKGLNETAGNSILIITHEMDIVAQYASRIIVMKRGAILMSGTPAEVFSRPDLLMEGFVKPPLATRVAQALDPSGAKGAVINYEGLLSAFA